MDVYDRLGVKKLINAWGTVTRIGGSLMAPEVLEAMREAAQAFVDLVELNRKASERIAQLIGVEAAFITGGAAAGLAIATAACMTGTDVVKIQKLPDTSGMKNEVVILRAHRNRYDQAIRQAGAKLIEVGLSDRTSLEELSAAVNDKTAAIAYFAESEHVRGSLPLEEIIKVAKAAKVPVLVDAAAELPPVTNLQRFYKLGADLIIFSGGKDLRGPQSSGLILGKKELIEACILNASPYHGIGRPMKVDKESIVGLLRAIELYLSEDHHARMERWERQVRYFIDELSNLPHVRVRRGFPAEPGIQPSCIPRAFVDLEEEKLRMTRREVIEALRSGEPGIIVGESQTGIVLNPQMLNPGEEQIVVQRLKQILSGQGS
jgi:L-seryl-tRNA(Ser) seleniumtransferase